MKKEDAIAKLKAQLEKLHLAGWQVTEYEPEKKELVLAKEEDLAPFDPQVIRAEANCVLMAMREDGKAWTSCFAAAAHEIGAAHGWRSADAYGLFCQMAYGWEKESFLAALPLAIFGKVETVPASFTVDGTELLQERINSSKLDRANTIDTGWITLVDEILPPAVKLHQWPGEPDDTFIDRVAWAIHSLDFCCTWANS